MLSKFCLSISFCLILLIGFKSTIKNQEETLSTSQEGIQEGVESKSARFEYFKQMLQDPKTGQIPNNVRRRELDFAKDLPKKRVSFKANTANNPENIEWQELGPNNIGGRTRALGIDVDDSNIILAGGVSGGIWKSTDGGLSWTSKSSTLDQLSVTWLIQDKTSVNNDTWFYSSGEFSGNSTGTTGASFYGSGIYKSTDNGESWSLLANSAVNDVSFNSAFDYISKLVINPSTGTLFMTSNVGAIYSVNKTTGSVTEVLGAFAGARYPDLAINQNGLLLATLSENSFGSGTYTPGVFISTDDGANWNERTPSSFPPTHDRSFITFAPSAPDTAYIITYTGSSSGGQEDIRFHFMEFSAGDTAATEDRSANIPNFGGSVGDIAQSNYNMIMAVKPDDSEFVLIGFTNLYRSRDAFKTAASTASDNWIGGYATANDVSQYADHHPDQHSLFFDPNNADELWSGHDGGLSKVDDITPTGSVDWDDMNNGYNVTQFYDVAIPNESGDHRIMGGTQDNGTPTFFTKVNGDEQVDASTGDGAYSYFADNFLYASSQNGNTRRYSYNVDGLGGFNSGNFSNFANVSPRSASGQLFINPFAIDTNDEKIMFYPSGDDLWRNTDIEDLTVDGNYDIDDWEDLTNLSPPSGVISSLVVTESNPDHRLYYGVYNSGSAPKIFRVDNASTATNIADNLTDISIGSAASGSYPGRITVNPKDGKEVMVVFTNYSVESIFHSSDGGSTWSSVEGNLDDGDNSTPGISIRDAAIIPLESDTLYMVTTSTGVYSTKELDGSSTVWSQEGANVIGNVVSTVIAHRTSDNTIVVGTHGRGIFGKIPKEQQLTGSAGWRILSAPVEDMAISEITDDTPIQGFGDGFDKNFYTGYDGTGFTSPADLSGNLKSGEGFILYLFNNTNAGSSELPIPIQSAGAEPTGDIIVNLHANGDRYNIIGNPYNAAIDFDLVSKTEVENKWWVWDNSTRNYLTYNGTTGVSESNNDGRIAPWQGFFVRSNDGASSPAITFSQDDKDKYNATHYKNRDSKLRTIKFYVEGNGMIDNNTAAVFYEGGMSGEDSGDMEELSPLSDEFVSMYFVQKENESSLNLTNDARSYSFEEEIFELDLNASKTGDFELSWEFENIPEDWEIKLLDMRTDTEINLFKAQTYMFNYESLNNKKINPFDVKSLIFEKENQESRFQLVVSSQTSVSIDDKIELPKSFELKQNYPNPFNPTTTISYTLPATSNVTLSVFDLNGKKVAQLESGRKSTGTHIINFDASALSSGTYFYRLKAGNNVQTKKMVLIK